MISTCWRDIYAPPPVANSWPESLETGLRSYAPSRVLENAQPPRLSAKLPSDDVCRGGLPRLPKPGVVGSSAIVRSRSTRPNPASGQALRPIGRSRELPLKTA
jgi:hypothetical protein